MRRFNSATFGVLVDHTTAGVLGDPQIVVDFTTVNESGRATETVSMSVEAATRFVAELNRVLYRAMAVRMENKAKGEAFPPPCDN